MSETENKILSFKNICQFIGDNEGLRLKAYKCPAGKTTIGYGRNLDDKGISEHEAELLIWNDVIEIYNQLSKTCDFFTKLNNARKMVIFDMVYNLGFSGFMKFNKMIGALEIEDYETAANEIQNSNYFQQVGKRAERNVEIMRTGKIDG